MSQIPRAFEKDLDLPQIGGKAHIYVAEYGGDMTLSLHLVYERGYDEEYALRIISDRCYAEYLMSVGEIEGAFVRKRCSEDRVDRVKSLINNALEAFEKSEDNRIRNISLEARKLVRALLRSP